MTLDVCSSRRYHMEERMTKAGWQTDSKIPSRVRTIIRPVKLVQAAWQANVMPQATMQKLRYLAMGTRVRIQFCGYSTIRTAM